MLRLTLLVAALSLASISKAWSINGHLFVANIAQNLLEEQAPDAMAAANEMLTYLQDYDSEMTYREVDHDFVECATFADDYKYHGEGWQGDFHFIDYPWIEEGSPEDYDVKECDRNLTTGIQSIVDWLSGKNGDDYKTSYIYLHLMDEFNNDEDVGKSYALRLLVHYMGDIAQPFHSENRYNSEFPDGDTGANDFPLPYHYEVDELHALWDKVLYEEHNNIARPFTEESWDEFQPRVLSVMETYADAVADPSTYESLDYEKFAQESYDIAITLYDGVYENEAVPQPYLDKNIPIAYSQINLGGYRLAYTIKYIFEDQAATSFTASEEDIKSFLQ